MMSEIKETKLCGNTNTGMLKLIAVFFMVMDHAGKIFFSLSPSIPEMRVLGRIAFPLYAWSLVVGSEYTKNIWKYALRLLIVGVVSQPFYMLALNHGLKELNVFATLFLGLAGIAGIKEKKYGSQYWAPVLAVLAGAVVTIDYGWKGVIFILFLYGCRKDKGALCCMMTAFCLYWGQGTSTIQSLFGFALPQVSRLSTLLTPIYKMQFFALLALPFILTPMETQTRIPKWLSYLAYPGHLAVLYLLKLML